MSLLIFEPIFETRNLIYIETQSVESEEKNEQEREREIKREKERERKTVNEETEYEFLKENVEEQGRLLLNV